MNILCGKIFKKDLKCCNKKKDRKHLRTTLLNINIDKGGISGFLTFCHTMMSMILIVIEI